MQCYLNCIPCLIYNIWIWALGQAQSVRLREDLADQLKQMNCLENKGNKQFTNQMRLLRNSLTAHARFPPARRRCPTGPESIHKEHNMSFSTEERGNPNTLSYRIYFSKYEFYSSGIGDEKLVMYGKDSSLI